MSFRKNPISRTIRKKQRGYRSGLGITSSAGIKSAEDRAKTHAGGKAKVRATGEQHKAKVR